MMSQCARIGICIDPVEAFWVQVHEAIYRASAAQSIGLIPFNSDNFPLTPTPDEENALLEEIFSQELDVIIGWFFPEPLAYSVLNAGIAIVHLSETAVRHPLSVSPVGLQRAAEQITSYLAEKMTGEGHILLIGGLLQADRPDDGRSRLSGVENILSQYPGLKSHHLATHWDPPRATAEIQQALKSWRFPIDAIIGLSDTLALIGCEIALELGLCSRSVPVVGINGDPSALTAIINGAMLATIETPAADFGEQAFNIAMRIVNGQSYPQHFDYKSQLITAENATEVATSKLISISNFPSLLAGSNHQKQHEYLTYLETSLRISHEIGTIHDEHQLALALSKLIQANYGYDAVQLALWSEREQTLRVLNPSANPLVTAYSLLETGILGEALTRNEMIFIPDLQRSFRFEPDPNWTTTHTRVVIPIRHSTAILGLLDLHAFKVIHCTREHLLGLQSLADQLGVALRNLKLYQEVVQAKAVAEKAEQLKTRLMANVSHELRNPLQIILNYAEQLSADTTAAEQIYSNAQHLLRLINDLLDLARAEVNELRIVPEVVNPGVLLKETFDNMRLSDVNPSTVEWRLQLPDSLPIVQVDSDRFRQVLLNLLNNAKKFTSSGSISLGADHSSTHLHIWIQDTGAGISPEQQENLFVPFAAANDQTRRREGIGLGLSITRRIIALHGGSMTVDSQAGRGSTFHIYLPLPSLKDTLPVLPLSQPTQSVLYLVSHGSPHPHIVRYCQREGLDIKQITSVTSLDAALQDGLPYALAWDTDDTSPEITQVVRRLCGYPALCEVPFLLFDSASISGGQAGETSLFLKPARARNLLSFITAMFAPEDEGVILIVDDDRDAREFYASVVSEHLPRYTIQTAANGVEAVNIMNRQTPSLVILDLLMPEMDGFEVTERMRTNPQTQHVPVVILSGKMLTFDDIQRLKDFRKLAFQTKHILTEDELASAFQQVLIAETSRAPETSAIAKQAVAYIQNRYEEPITRADIAQAIGVSENYLTQVFHDEMGIALWEYLNRYRISRSKDLLVQSGMTVAQVAMRVGFDDPAYFSRLFRRHTGQSPRAFRKSS